ncbi:hypothetical protein NDU88_007236 [Pleurodeles waltl]|uniref:Uncharacterized protein n=1 Tax=Pleurodeles waltl TaxID=8319 RepID=A0AAV7QP88_PLEWA|nr:hypothetical protein NDU88_007236 [Pleurodeles waltl]
MGSGSLVCERFVEPICADASGSGARGVVDEAGDFVGTGSSEYNSGWEVNGKSGMDESVEDDSIASRVKFDGRIRQKSSRLADYV